MMKYIKFFAIITLVLALFSCESLNVPSKPLSRELTGLPQKNASSLVAYFFSQNPNCDKQQVHRLAQYYIEESREEGINSDCAFAQMCLETGYLRFGNLVVPEMHNYCGLGAIDKEHPGEWFETERLGVRAHIQHLHAYATPENVSLKNPLVDNRYKYVRPRGKAPTIWELSGTWAMDKQYSIKLDEILNKMQNY